MRIAVVEDEIAIADFLERGLRAEGYEVQMAADALVGERTALDPDVDLVILDRMCVDMRRYVGDLGTPGDECPKGKCRFEIARALPLSLSC